MHTHLKGVGYWKFLGEWVSRAKNFKGMCKPVRLPSQKVGDSCYLTDLYLHNCNTGCLPFLTLKLFQAGRPLYIYLFYIIIGIIFL